MLARLEDYSPTILILLGVGVLYILTKGVQQGIAYHRQSWIIRTNGCKPCPAYPHKDPIFGLDLFLINLKLSRDGGFLEGVRNRYKALKCRTFSQITLGERMIMTCEPENVKAILATQFKQFELPPRRKNAFDPIFGHGIFTTDGADWEASRALLRPSFTRSQVGDIETFEEHISKLLARIPRDGSTVDLQELFFELTLDSATDFLFGHSTNVLDRSDPNRKRGQRFGEAFAYVTMKAGLEGRVGKLATILPDKRYKVDTKYVHEYVSNYVREAVQLRKDSPEEKQADEENSGRYVFLEHLAKADYPEKKIQDELLNILLAGRDTTAGLLSFLFHLLARHPQVWDKLREEALALGSGTPTFEHIKSMKYMQWVLNETLRLQPIVPANARVANCDTTIPTGGGPDGKSPVFVKAGQMVAYQVYVMQRREDLFGEDATEFKPERWETLRPSWNYLPFNGGPRICIGQQFALIEASYAVARILQTFKSIEKRDDSDDTEYLTVTSQVRAGTKVALTPA
ncbi:cytochrome P450 [Amylocarpus encephaloides]|uniref:Cytochrome P450 n=1 Tax=Amylocarpus encephaloides TaxID=45428 RepID=A0A9P7YRD3_9HELO|nr:cytochrome P450 [Amylocarpus encephaloides]